MHARMGTLYTYPNNFEHVLQVLRDTVFPAAQRNPGFTGFLIMSDRQANKVIGITLWESEAEMLASATGEYLQEQISRIIPNLRRPPEFESYALEVL